MGGAIGSGFATPTLQAHTGAPPHPAAVVGAISALAANGGPDFSSWHYNSHHNHSTGGAVHNNPGKGHSQAPNLNRLTVPSRPPSNLGHADFQRHSTPPMTVPHGGLHSTGGGGLAGDSTSGGVHGQHLAAEMDGLPPRPVTPSLNDSHVSDGVLMGSYK
jgi:hypothetical protein